MNVTAYDLEDKLTITGLVLGETKTYEVDHDATIVEEDGTELRIAPKDVQYQMLALGTFNYQFRWSYEQLILGVLVLLSLPLFKVVFKIRRPTLSRWLMVVLPRCQV